ncbi:uncharacterized protein G2W53_039440 [Senna tora]|uniref:Uncharacterized protein n=1 Tax=Senna tora TaxID=362788 RepID=A0A834SNM2_9FABA|nr:uncharacterized protein G2W53_039440 [Senna tora]
MAGLAGRTQSSKKPPEKRIAFSLLFSSSKECKYGCRSEAAPQKKQPS